MNVVDDECVIVANDNQLISNGPQSLNTYSLSFSVSSINSPLPTVPVHKAQSVFIKSVLDLAQLYFPSLLIDNDQHKAFIVLLNRAFEANDSRFTHDHALKIHRPFEGKGGDGLKGFCAEP
jgi:hypothetical protein